MSLCDLPCNYSLLYNLPCIIWHSSNVCKLAALGFGFERAFGFDDNVDHLMGNINREKRRWVDVDVDGRIEPAWNAFELH